MAPRPLVTTVLLAALVSACAHHHRDRVGPEVLQALKDHEAWLSKLPSCSRSMLPKATGVAELGPADDDTPVVVRGLLVLGAAWSLNDIGCPENRDDCCTGSFVSWVVAPPAAIGQLPAREVRVRLAAETEDMGVGARDCEMSDLRVRARKTDVVVTGRLAAHGQLIVDAAVCLVAATM